MPGGVAGVRPIMAVPYADLASVPGLGAQVLQIIRIPPTGSEQQKLQASSVCQCEKIRLFMISADFGFADGSRRAL